MPDVLGKAGMGILHDDGLCDPGGWALDRHAQSVGMKNDRAAMKLPDRPAGLIACDPSAMASARRPARVQSIHRMRVGLEVDLATVLIIACGRRRVRWGRLC